MSFNLCARSGIVAFATAALLGGCGSGTPPSGSSGMAPSTRTPIGTEPVKHLNRGKSWMLPDAGKQWLLYVSDGETGTVDVYNYRAQAGKLYGQITGFSFPYGECVDASGDVYVVDNDTAKIAEFAHAGTKPMATATDKYGLPIGCSVDSSTGNIAVTNFSDPSDGPGGVVVFAGSLSGKQTNYTNSTLYHFQPGGYDPNGNFFVQGTQYSGPPAFGELPAGQKTFTMLTGLTVGYPGAVGWDGAHLFAVDQNYQFYYTTMIYRITVAGSAVTIVGQTQLTDTCYPYRNWMVAIQPYIGGTTRKQNAVVAGNLNCPSREDWFNYTTGGNPKRSLPSAIAPKAPYGQTVSPPA
jgi:hypothetical protein